MPKSTSTSTKVVTAHIEGYSIPEISKRYKLPQLKVHTLIRRHYDKNTKS